MTNAPPATGRRPAAPVMRELDPTLAASPLVEAVRAIAEIDDAWARFGCPHCGKRNKCPGTLRGAIVGCAKCGREMTVPLAHHVPDAEVPVPHLSTSAAEALATLSAPVSRPKPRKAWPWWLLVAHASLPIGTIATLYYLKTHGYLPGLSIGW